MDDSQNCILESAPIHKKCECKPVTNRTKYYSYEQYYIGEKDKKERRSGEGSNHWTSAQSMECYTGRWIRDAMNGKGEYRWRYLGPKGLYFTYEGDFCANTMHGYGTMSFPDGRIFSGLFQKDVRFGPGVETHLSLHEDVGLWRGRQLLRLTWQPLGPSITPDFRATPLGRSFLNFHRVILSNTVKTVQKSNSLIMESLTKEDGDILLALNLWPKPEDKPFFLPQNETDLDTFKNDCFEGKMNFLNISKSVLDLETHTSKENETTDEEETKMYYVWNNTDIMIQIMKRCYLHEQRRHTDLNVQLEKILNGPRKAFKPASYQERHCRSLLMASYLGYIAVVSQLLTECNIFPDVSDNQGNTALMYATCGDKTDVIHFLTEAGANANSYNDCCLTPLGVAIIRYVCVRLNINSKSVTQAFLPPPQDMPALPDVDVSDWLISRDLPLEEFTVLPDKGNSTTNDIDLISENAAKVLNALRETIAFPDKTRDTAYPLLEAAYFDRVSEDYSSITFFTQPYIFTATNMLNEVEAYFNSVGNRSFGERTKNELESVGKKSTVLGPKDLPKKKETSTIQVLTKRMQTIMQLLKGGGDCHLVRCPQPALLMAVVSQSAELVKLLVDHGADVNEKYPTVRNYYALDVAIAGPLTLENFAIINTLLKGGADVDHHLESDYDPGPSLVHALLAKKVTTFQEEQLLGQIFQVLVDHNCDPKALYKGQSVMDIIIQLGNLSLLDIIIKTAKVDLNQSINDKNQATLVKLFTPSVAENISVEKWCRTIANLLHYGADPFMTCQDNEKTYCNIFHFVKEQLQTLLTRKLSLKSTGKVNTPPMPTKEKDKGKEKEKENGKETEKSHNSTVELDIEVLNFKQGIDLVINFSRDWLIRWLCVKLVRDIIAHIMSNKHLAWDAILKRYKHQKITGLWLSPQRCLEIWHILTVSKWKVFKYSRMKKDVLCMVFVCHETKGSMQDCLISAEYKNRVICQVSRLISQHKTTANMSSKPRRERYVTPEFYIGNEEKYNVCFECLQCTDNEDSFYCSYCQFIKFCSTECLNNNILYRASDHPCSSYLKEIIKLNITPDSQ